MEHGIPNHIRGKTRSPSFQQARLKRRVSGGFSRSGHRGFTLIEVLIGAMILASAGIVLARALASIAATDAAAMVVLAESETVRDELNQVELDLMRNPEERQPGFFSRDRQLRDRPGWTIRTRCRATERDPDRLWEVQTTIDGGRWKAPTSTWVYRPPLPAKGAVR